MHDDKHEPAGGGARRRFLQAAGLAAAGFTLARPAWARAAGPEDDGCGCDAAPALPVYAVAWHQGAYVALASTGTGLGLFSLQVDSSPRAGLGARLDAALPEGFLPASLGVGGGELLITGGLRFVWATLEADDEADPAALEAMHDWPAHVPQRGRRTIDVPGLRPAAFALEFPSARAVALPDLPRRVFGALGGVSEAADGSLALLYEHSGALPESAYASSVDVLVRRGRAWSTLPAGRDLGESGPNLVTADGAGFVVGLRTLDRTTLVRPGQERPLDSPSGRVLALISSRTGASLLVSDGAGARAFANDGATWRAGAEVRLPEDEIVGALPVAGAPGQTLLLGRRSASIADENSVLWGRASGGETHVV
jgi:hypothetical protein